MSQRIAKGLAWSACGFTALVSIGGVVFFHVIGEDGHPSGGPDVAVETLYVGGLATTALCGMGALVAGRHPRNPIGWLFCLVSTALALALSSGEYAVYAVFIEPGSLPAGETAGWLSSWVWVLGLPLAVTFTPLLFPDGRLPSPRWRPVAWIAGLALVCLAAGLALSPGELDGFPRENPYGLAGAAGDVAEAMRGLGVALLVIGGLATMASVVARFRRSHGVERAQLKWFATAALFLPGVWLAYVVFEQLVGELPEGLPAVAFMPLPIAASVAILRYRLYDIDVVINRTLIYGALSATLASTYLAMVLVLQLALSPLTAESDLAIAASTLAVAALFRPARRRIQELVDRRFYRRRYDAARTLEAFSARLREEVDLDALSVELRAVVRETMQPAHVSLWLREPAQAAIADQAAASPTQGRRA